MSDEKAIRAGQLQQARGDGENAVREFSLSELTDAAGVSVRTVRYYIAEGLLPPPQGAGPSSAYTSGHLDRLRLIQRLKAAYFPLKEIRRRLAGLTDDEVSALLSGAEAGSADFMPEHPLDATLAGAREYLALLESPAQYRTEPLALFAAPPDAHEKSPPAPGDFQFAARHELHVDDDRVQRSARVVDRLEEVPEPPLWRRLPLGDEVELVISDRVYARHRERVDWLVRWARKVFA